MKTLILLLSLSWGVCYAQSPIQGRVPAASTIIKPLEQGPGVFGVYDGRTPCQDIAKSIGLAVTPDCFKLKWRVTLYQDPKSQLPTTYKLETTFNRTEAATGKWSKIKLIRNNKEVIVYRLAAGTRKESLSFLRGDDNVLFFLDKNNELLAGDENFSYTLNRKGI